jgi:spermidine synthase
VKTSQTPWPQVYLCISLTTLATLLLELSLTRIFSVIFHHHFAFLAISIALFGMGLGGVFSYVVAEWKAPLFIKLGRLSAINSIAVVAALAVILTQGGNLRFWNYALVYFTTAVPFFFAGAIVSLAISETIERVNKVYFFDLLGAAAGCMLLLPLLEWFGGPSTVIGAAVFFAAAAAIWYSMAGTVRGRAGSVALALALVAFLMINVRQQIVDIRFAKNHALENEIFVKWNSFSRIGLTHKEGEMDMIVIDADASTGVFGYDLSNLSRDERRELLNAVESLPYAVRPGAKALIIGPGGGWDVARALTYGSRDITGVEINPIIARTIMQERFPKLSRNLYLRPEVRIFEEDGRSFIRRSAEKYQVVQATLVDTWASTAAGAFALTENNLYTTDALRDYLQHLTDDGLIAFTRWGFEPPRESLRFVSLAIEALLQLGETSPAEHVMVGRAGSVEGWGSKDTVMISRKPFTAADIGRARALMEAAGLEAVYLPGAEIRNQFYELLHASSPAQFQRDYTFDISPVTDNRPFFFYTVQPRDLWNFVMTASHASADWKINTAVPLLFGLMAISLIATAVTLLAPPLVLGARLPRLPGVRSFLLYFVFVGIGYILIEVALIQKFVLFLGHPTYALTVVVFSMLVSSGLGSFMSRRLLGKDEGRLIKALGLVALLAVLLAVLVSGLLSALVGLAWGLKAALTIVLIAPLGFMMGMPFPVGLQRLEEWHAPSVRWAWSLNAASSVLGSVGSLVCAIYLGLVQTLMVGGLFYLAALAVIARVGPGGVEAPEPGPGRVVLAK